MPKTQERPGAESRGAPEIQLVERDRSQDTPDRPALGALRRERSLPLLGPHPGLDQAVRLHRHGWNTFENAVAHLVLGARVTCRGAAPCRTRRRVVEVLEAMSDDDLDGLADELLVRAGEHRR